MPETLEVTALRMRIGERIPAGGTADDTMFSEAELQAIVNNNSTPDGAALEAWEAKRAELANLVNVTDGAASRALSDAFAHADDMVVYYTRKVNGRSGRTRIGKIIRE